jgi:hypothetical protein
LGSLTSPPFPVSSESEAGGFSTVGLTLFRRTRSGSGDRPWSYASPSAPPALRRSRSWLHRPSRAATACSARAFASASSTACRCGASGWWPGPRPRGGTRFAGRRHCYARGGGELQHSPRAVLTRGPSSPQPAIRPGADGLVHLDPASSGQSRPAGSGNPIPVRRGQGVGVGQRGFRRTVASESLRTNSQRPCRAPCYAQVLAAHGSFHSMSAGSLARAPARLWCET